MKSLQFHQTIRGASPELGDAKSVSIFSIRHHTNVLVPFCFALYYVFTLEDVFDLKVISCSGKIDYFKYILFFMVEYALLILNSSIMN